VTISLKDMIAELRRVLRHRQVVYPSLIRRGGLTQAAADRQNARLRAAMDLLVSLETPTGACRGHGITPPR
jgi:hypothetical protein